MSSPTTPGYLAHMRLKNWVFSLFQPGKSLFEEGFSNVLPTPVIQTAKDQFLTPDLLAWSDDTALFFSCKSGAPRPTDDMMDLDHYLALSQNQLQETIRTRGLTLEGVLLYYDRSLGKAAKLSLENSIGIASFLLFLQLNTTI